jgi:hypothetical protein
MPRINITWVNGTQTAMSVADEAVGDAVRSVYDQGSVVRIDFPDNFPS